MELYFCRLREAVILKKRKVIAVLFVLVLLSLAGCQKENWTVYEIAGADEDTVCFDYSGETYELSSIADYKREAAETSSKFVLGKQEYALRYDETCNREFLSYHEDIYKTEDKNATFYFREDTGDLSGVFVKGKALTISENKPKVKEDYQQNQKGHLPSPLFHLLCPVHTDGTGQQHLGGLPPQHKELAGLHLVRHSFGESV